MTAGTFHRFADHQYYNFSNKTSNISSNPQNRRTMKRPVSSIPNDENFNGEPQRKRSLYEERMSNKLWNFHINENNGNQQLFQTGSNGASYEELDNWGIDDFELTDAPEPLIEEPSGLIDSTEPVASSSGIVLSDQLKLYMDTLNKRDDFAFFKGTKTGQELILYRPRSLIDADENGSTVDDDIRNRIHEVEDWIEDNDSEDGFDSNSAQFVSFPDCSSLSVSSSSSSSNLSMKSDSENRIYDTGAISESSSPGVGGGQDEMDID